MPFLSDVLFSVYDRLAWGLTTESPTTPTGLKELDESFGGWARQQLSYLVGDSGVGKSWLALLWAVEAALWYADGHRAASTYVEDGTISPVSGHVADKEGKPPVVVFWSLEMSETPMIVRLLAFLAHRLEGVTLDSAPLMRGDLGVPKGTPEWDERIALLTRLYEYIGENLGQHIYFEFSSRSISDFERVLSELALVCDVNLIIVDYFHLIDELTPDGNPVSAQASRSKKLTRIAKVYDTHVLSLFALTREGQKAKHKGAIHMKGGTAAQYDSDLVFILSRKEDEDSPLYDPVEAHLVFEIAKNRYGPRSTIELWADFTQGKFAPWYQRK